MTDAALLMCFSDVFQQLALVLSMLYASIRNWILISMSPSCQRAVLQSHGVQTPRRNRCRYTKEAESTLPHRCSLREVLNKTRRELGSHTKNGTLRVKRTLICWARVAFVNLNNMFHI